MTGQNAAVAIDPEPRWRAWIWFSDIEVPESGFTCQAHLEHETETWLTELYWEGEMRFDEVTGSVYWGGRPLEPGDTLRLREGDKEIGFVRILGEPSE
jgi:hypothetical protein